MRMNRCHLSSKKIALVAAAFLLPFATSAKKPIRTAFFDTYPAADGTTLSDVASNSGHCGMCHYDFNGGGTRNPYGAAVEAERAGNGGDSVAAFLAIEPSTLMAMDILTSRKSPTAQ